MRTDWVSDKVMENILAALMPANRLVMRVSLATGLRVGDVLALRPAQVKAGRFTVHEQKTGKARRVRLPNELRRALLEQAGRFWVFPNRLDVERPRTRQAVFKDVRRAAVAFRVHGTIAPHTARKVYAVHAYEASGRDLARVRDLLNHSNEAVTWLYAMADAITEKRGLTSGARGGRIETRREVTRR